MADDDLPDLSPLFAPFTCGSMTIANRIAMAPMTRSHSPDGIPTPAVAEYYRRRAEGGTGLIISEGTGIDRPASVDSEFIPRFHGEQALSGWRRVIEAVHGAGGAMGPQLWHVGGAPRGAHHPGGWQGEPESPSGLFSPDTPIGRTMTETDIEAVIAAYAHAAGQARTLGFDCVEFHGAHGYLFDQFIWEGANRRTDRFGGADLKARSRFGVEVMQAVRRAVGPDFPIIFRLSQWKVHDYEMKIANDPAALEAWLTPLSEAGVDIFHCSQRRFWVPEFEGSDLNLAGWVKQVTGKPTITVGSVGLSVEFMSSYHDPAGARPEPARLHDLMRRFERGDFDLVAVGRALLADAHWPNKLRTGRWNELNEYRMEHRQVLS